MAPRIKKSNLRRFDVVGPSERLSITLRYLVTGDSHVTISASYRISPPTVWRIVNETCLALWDVLKEDGILSHPSDEDGWKKVTSDFETKWNFPHCLGAIDGKHIVMQAPARSGTSFFNYKKTHSIVLLAVCNADYLFILVDVGDSDRNSDGGAFKSSALGYAIDNGLLHIPDSDYITNTNTVLPYVFVVHKAFQKDMVAVLQIVISLKHVVYWKKSSLVIP